MQRLFRVGAGITATALLIAPAIWNRFPLLQHDTGGYFARWFEGYLVPSRSTVYGLFLAVLSQPDFWPVIVIQAAVTVWTLALLLRAHGLSNRPILLVGTTAVLSVLTTLPWLVSILLTDIFAGLAVLSIYLLSFADNALHRVERFALVALLAFAIATHSATFAVAIALVAAAAFARGVVSLGSTAGVARSAAAVALGALLLVGANFAVARQLAWTPGGLALAFGRMLQDGIVARYLADRCPDPRLRLCDYRHELPTDADVFFWGESIFDRLGRFRGMGDEMSTIVLESLRDYPLLQTKLALVATARQLVRVDTGEGVIDSLWHTYAIIEKFSPSAVADMRAARQQQGELGFAAINRVHRPVTLVSMALLLPIIVVGAQRRRLAATATFSAITALALLANAVVCGVLANPHDRYGARLAWLPPLVVMVTLIGRPKRPSALSLDPSA